MRRTVPVAAPAAVVGAVVAAPNDDFSLSAENASSSPATIAITIDRYSHVIEGMDREAAETVAGLIR